MCVQAAAVWVRALATRRRIGFFSVRPGSRSKQALVGTSAPIIIGCASFSPLFLSVFSFLDLKHTRKTSKQISTRDLAFVFE
jgi:hypothetical protein